MNFEVLANELILYIFEYLNGIHLLRSFHNLNSRLNNLIYLYFQTCPLDFRAITKSDFDYICHEKLPSIIDRITLFRLSDDFDTPEQPQLLYSYGFTFQQFINLRSLSLYYICSTKLLNKLIIDCRNLIYLNITKSYFNDDDFDTIELCMDNIWSLSKLTYCYLDIDSSGELFISLPSSIVSSSIKHLSFKKDSLALASLAELFELTPNLQTLYIQCHDLSNTKQLPSVYPLLTKLTILYTGSSHCLTHLLQTLPNLTYLMIETHCPDIHGYPWEEIIVTHLQKLKIFRLMMIFRLKVQGNIHEQIDTLLETFKTRFWLEDHQWFIRCDCNTDYGTTHVYTLPNMFKALINFDPHISKSTCLDDKKYRSFNCVDTLEFDSEDGKSSVEFSIQYPNINHLELCFPFEEFFWLILPSFDRLKSVELVSVFYGDEDERKDYHFNQLRMFFDRAMHLYSVVMDDDLLTELSSYKITSKSIRRLDIQASDGKYYGTECISLIHSFLNVQCEVIFINLQKRTVVIDIVNAMPNLRAMNIQCGDDTWNDNDKILQKEDELVHWLQHHLPSTCSIVRDDGDSSTIRLWIR